MPAKKNTIAFTQLRLSKLTPPATGRETWYDSGCTGLGLIVTANGCKTFVVYRKIKGRPVRVRFGRFPEITVEAARDHARQLVGDIAKGIDPQARKIAARQEMTLCEVFTQWLEKHAKVHKKTWNQDKWMFDRFLKTKLGGRKISDVRTHDVAQLHRKIGEDNGHYQANRVLSLIETIFNFASGEELRLNVANSARGVQRFPEEKRDRFLQKDELPKLFAALDGEEDLFKDFFKICLLTGARRGNVASMAWANVDFPWRLWRIPKTKSGIPVVVPLVDPAIEILQRRLEESPDGNPWVFPSPHRLGSHIVDPKTAWARVLKRAGLENLRIHDLRRTLGSWQAQGGTSLAIIGKSLGHTQTSTTQIYARLTLDPVRESVTRATTKMLEAAKPKQPNTTIPAQSDTVE